MILLHRALTPPVTRNKTGLAALLKRAPPGQHDLAFWLAWLKANF